MSLELRRATLHICRAYLEKVDGVKTMTASFTRFGDKPTREDVSDPANENDRDGEVKATEKDDDATAQGDGQDALDNDHAQGVRDESGQAVSGRPDDGQQRLPDDPLSMTPRRGVNPSFITQRELDKFDSFHNAMVAVVASLREGIARLEKRNKASFNFVWSEAGRLGGQGPIKPPRERPRATWRGHHTCLADVMDLDWLWQEEMQRANTQSGAYYRLDDVGRRVMKL